MSSLTAAPAWHTSALDGRTVSPADPGFDEARRAWNLAVEQKPAAVVFPESAQDVAAAVGRARDAGLRVAAQTTGHNASPLGSLHDTVLLKPNGCAASPSTPNAAAPTSRPREPKRQPERLLSARC